MVDMSESHATLWRALESDWQLIVRKALGKQDLGDLVAHSDDGIAIGPIQSRPSSSIAIRRTGFAGKWSIVQRADDPDEGRALRLLEIDLAGGASGIELVLAGSASADRTGLGLRADGPRLLEALSKHADVQVRLDAGAATFQHYRRLRDLMPNTLILCFDPLAEAAARGGFDSLPSAFEDTLASTALEFLDGGHAGSAVVTDGRVWAAGGASEAQEIAAILGSLVHSARILIARGLSPEATLGTIGIVADAGPNQLLTIAKLRALRLCHARVVEAFAVEPMPANIHAETSWRMMTRHDVNTNILRSTSAALAAGIAGADSITVLPSTIAAGLPDAFARRVARNTQKILLEESGLANVDDPGSGSGAIESLTASLAESAWTIFRKLEAAGGLAEALRIGTFQNDIAQIRQDRAGRVAHRALAITGVSTFPHVDDAAANVVTDLPTDKTEAARYADAIERLPAARYAEPFEDLRDRTAKLVRGGAPPKVFLASLGRPIDFTDSVQAATNFFAIAGIPVIETEGLETPADVAEAFSTAGTPFACISASKGTPPEQTDVIARAFKERGALRVYAVDVRAADGGVDAVIDDEVDAIAVLSDLLSLCESKRK